jgi:integrase
LLDKYAPYTVLNCRKVCRQAITEAVKFGLIPANPFDLVKAPRARRVKAGRALSPADATALITASQELRLGAAVTLLFCQGWRVSEVLGLAWKDLDLDAGTAQIRRGASYTSLVGMVVGSTKTSGAEGVHHLAPVSVAHLRTRQAEQQLEREAMGAEWRIHVYDGEKLSMPFTAAHGGLANRQAVTKEIGRAAKIAGLDPEGLASHSGRRTVVTALYADGGLDLADVARHVGHSDPSTTAEYVRSLGHRPSDTAARAASVPNSVLRRSRYVRRHPRQRCARLPDHERVEVPSDDVAMGASDLVIRVPFGASSSRRYGTPHGLASIRRCRAGCGDLKRGAVREC